MQKYYTAVGRFECKGRMGDMTCPMVIINKREYALDIQEMILWATLNWQIMDARVLEDMNEVPASYFSEGRKKLTIEFITNNGITRRDITEYAPAFPDKAMRTLVESEIIYHVTQ
jgi:hypothetical protein